MLRSHVDVLNLFVCCSVCVEQATLRVSDNAYRAFESRARQLQQELVLQGTQKIVSTFLGYCLSADICARVRVSV